LAAAAGFCFLGLRHYDADAGRMEMHPADTCGTSDTAGAGRISHA